jgi:acetyl-CoA carboxylase carboxyltransferase component
VAGGAYLPALSDFIIMVEGTSFMGLGGPNLVKGAVGQIVDSDALGGARAHNEISGVAHFRAKNDEECILRLREFVTELPLPQPLRVQIKTANPPRRPLSDIYDIIPAAHRLPYDMRDVLDCLLDSGELDEFQADYAREMITGYARIEGIPVGIVANQRGLVRGAAGQPPKFGGIIYTDSAEKVAYFIETCNRHETPLLFLQDVSGFMVGTEAEHSGIIRAGARFVEAMATATVPKLVLTINHASGAGYYAMAGQGFDPDFIFTWPTGRMGVMEGESAVMALFSAELEKLDRKGQAPDEEMQAEMARVRAKYDGELEARFAGARGFVDAILSPENTRSALELALRTALNNPGPHLGVPVLP